MIYPAHLRLLALDMASVCGYARITSGSLISGSQDFRRGKLTHPGAPHVLFANWIRKELDANPVDLVIYEDAGFFKSADAVQICVGMRGVMLAETARRGIPVVSYAPMSVKKHFTGSGKSDKVAMMREFIRRFPDVRLADSNEADATALLFLHLSKIGIEELQLLAT